MSRTSSSAHFESVSTAPGATDDEIGIITLMHLVEHFAKESQPRTAVFNINNAEEDGLKGAHVSVYSPCSSFVVLPEMPLSFLQQPWFKIFLNLEGATAGG